jgi:drug/metabolite transporter (DMT)-like permease
VRRPSLSATDRICAGNRSIFFYPAYSHRREEPHRGRTILGYALIVAGVSLISVAHALIVAGIGAILIGLACARYVAALERHAGAPATQPSEPV